MRSVALYLALLLGLTALGASNQTLYQQQRTLLKTKAALQLELTDVRARASSVNGPARRAALGLPARHGARHPSAAHRPGSDDAPAPRSVACHRVGDADVMALKTSTNFSARSARKVAAKPKPKPTPSGDLRLKRRYLLLAVLLAPLLLAFYGFAKLQNAQPLWPTSLQEAPQRGRIVARDGTIFAEGGAEHREYPQGTLAAHVVGFSGALQDDGRYGLEGLELTQDATLARGDDVVLTLDPNLQAVAQAKLQETVQTFKAENGAVVMLEAGTGRILAAASYPDYDPNTQGSVQNRDHIVDKAFVRLFEPGSVMKPFVVASLLTAGRLRLDEYIDTPMHLRVGDKTFSDVTQHDPQLTPWDILRFSSNSGMINLTQRFKDFELHDWLERFGFGRDLDLGATYTRTGQVRDTPWVPQDQASITIGQSMSTTALQLAAAYSIFANDGLYIPPYLVEGGLTAPTHQVIPPEIAMTIRSLLQYTAENSGIHRSAIPGVTMAGKTGTGDIFDLDTGTYIKGDYTLTFAGMMPADKPKFIMIATIQKPRSDAPTSTAIAVPLFSSIASEAVALWQTPGTPTSYATTR